MPGEDAGDSQKATEAPQPTSSPPNPGDGSSATGPSLPSPPLPNQTPNVNSSPSDRSELLSRARGFLLSHQVQNQDIYVKRQFLREKGLSEVEIDGLLRELPYQVPLVPPRTYPPPPPSALPNLIVGILRVFSWILGGSTALIILYHRLILPRITRTSVARQSLKSHHLSLIRKLTTDLASLKELQSESYSILPRPEPYKEPDELARCLSIDAILKKEVSPQDIPPITLLRCAMADFAKLHKHEAPSTEELFQIMEARLPYLASPEGAAAENNLWETLTTCPLFKATPDDSSSDPSSPRQTRWSYHPPTPPPPTPLRTSLQSLTAAMPKPDTKEQPSNVFQYTLQALTNFTGYISTQVYLPYRPPGMNTSLGPAEDELRREIRALKGLVLNRRSFLPSLPRTNSAVQ